MLIGIETGDPEQVWLYEIATRRLIAVTEQPPADHRFYIQIRDLVWDQEILYISANHFRGSAGPSYAAATITRSDRIDSLPEQVAAAINRSKGQLGIYDLRREHNSRYAVSARNQGHGDLVLETRSIKGGAPRQIARASWELETFLFSGDRSEVLYPSRESITAFNLDTGQSRTVLQNAGRDLRLLDRTRDGKVIAYTVIDPHAGRPTLVRQPRIVCFAQIE